MYESGASTESRRGFAVPRSIPHIHLLSKDMSVACNPSGGGLSAPGRLETDEMQETGFKTINPEDLFLPTTALNQQKVKARA